jgi:type-F conjugative transfer system pilin assembly protein TrbC
MQNTNTLRQSAVALIFSVLATTAISQKLDLDEEAKKNLIKNRQAIESLGGQGGTPTQQINSQIRSNAATMDAITQLPGANQPLRQSSKEDFMALTGKMKPPVPDPNKGYLLMFVSMSMPEKTLMEYSRQARRFGATLVLRGFVDDKLSSTQKRIMKLNAEGAEWQINPEPFKQFKITKVPTIVLANGEASVLEDGCAKPNTYASISGDINLKAALDRMALYAQPGIATLAKRVIAQDQQAGKMRKIQ